MSNFNFKNFDLKLHIGKSYSYSKFSEILGISRYGNKEKRDRQLEKLKEHIDFKIENNKYIILGIKDEGINIEREFFTLKDFYNKRIEIDRYEILKFVIMNFLKDEMRGETSDKWRGEYITTYDRLAVDLGLVNKLFYHIIFRCAKLSKEINIKEDIVDLMIKSTRRAYFRFIKRGLEELKEEGFIDYKSGLWGHRETFVSRGRERVHEKKINSDTVKTNKSWVKLNEEQEKLYKEVLEEARREINKFNLIGEAREKMFGEIINDKMYKACGLSHIGERAEIKLTSKGGYKFLKNLKEVNREKEWLAKQFYERLRSSREEAFGKREGNNKKHLETYILLLEIFIKKMRNNPREDLKQTYEKVSKFVESKIEKISSIETGEVEYRRV